MSPLKKERTNHMGGKAVNNVYSIASSGHMRWMKYRETKKQVPNEDERAKKNGEPLNLVHALVLDLQPCLLLHYKWMGKTETKGQVRMRPSSSKWKDNGMERTLP